MKNKIIKELILPIIIVALLLAGFSISYDFGFKAGFSKGFALSEKYEEVKNGEAKFECPDLIKGYVYREYDKYPNGVRIDRVPKFVDNPQVIKMNEAYDNKKILESLSGRAKSLNWRSDSFDVNGDDKKEVIILANIYNEYKIPHDIALVLGNGNIIFRIEGIDLKIEENDGNGFVLSEIVDWNTGEYKHTRYIYKDGGFLPIWTQKSCWANFE
ncbi:hypothetical protein D4R99_05620 [bacterium]|nr:MAG: hypothetical protein D4R99_05620 [bacterium]